MNEGLGLLKLADTSLILINPSPSNVNGIYQELVESAGFYSCLVKSKILTFKKPSYFRYLPRRTKRSPQFGFGGGFGGGRFGGRHRRRHRHRFYRIIHLLKKSTYNYKILFLFVI